MSTVWSVRLCVCHDMFVYRYDVCTVSPPPQQVEEDEDYVQVDHERSVDVFLRIQTVAPHPHQQLTVDHQELRKKREEDLGHTVHNKPFSQQLF